jgi:septal ring factor EnvC (AmiA/AmiB activator)
LPIRARRSSFFAALLFLLTLFPPAVTAGEPPDAKRIELKERQGELRGRLETLRRDLAKTEGSQAEAADQLRVAESAISDSNRRLRQLAGQRSATEAELASLEAQSHRLDRQIDQQQTDLSRLLYHQYVRGDSDALQILLAGRDPNEVARDSHFLTLLSRAKAEMIGNLRTSLAEKQKFAATQRDKTAELAEIERTQQDQRATLLAQQRQRQIVLAQISDRIKTQRHEIDNLRRNDQRLTKLIDDLAKIIAQSERRKPKTKSVTSAKNKGRPAMRKNDGPDPGSVDSDFARLRGRLHLPVRGEIISRFGTPRAEGGAFAKGIFIRSNDGGDVHAVADGQVVYADWLRGFGNLMIIDHGDSFLSIYGNNQALLQQAGDAVRAGDAIATVGNSGGNPESGLYFELRHQGRPFDPIRWVSLL